jgi:hypothetical protein
VDSAQGRIIVNRTSPRDIKVRDLIVMVDALPRETLKFQQSMELPLKAGEHTVKVTNNLLSKDLPFTLAAGETATFLAGNVAGGCMGALVVTVGIYSVMLERVP